MSRERCELMIEDVIGTAECGGRSVSFVYASLGLGRPKRFWYCALHGPQLVADLQACGFEVDSLPTSSSPAR